MKITETFYYMCVKGMITIIVIKNPKWLFYIYIQFYNEKNQGENIWEQEIQEAKTHRNNQKEQFSKD